MFDGENETLQSIVSVLALKREGMEFAASVAEIKKEWEEEPDPFEEARIEAEKRHQDRLRKGKKKK